mmetsp:Transcript_30046/g.70019  ORF Transcript_30046/g.70019 Transcript_30046/m.70019 type:complete len:208 (+) Transcript_30046:66-689(+)
MSLHIGRMRGDRIPKDEQSPGSPLEAIRSSRSSPKDRRKAIATPISGKTEAKQRKLGMASHSITAARASSSADAFASPGQSMGEEPAAVQQAAVGSVTGAPEVFVCEYSSEDSVEAQFDAVVAEIPARLPPRMPARHSAREELSAEAVVFQADAAEALAAEVPAPAPSVQQVVSAHQAQAMSERQLERRHVDAQEKQRSCCSWFPCV